MIGSALVLGYLLHDYSPGQLIRVVQAVAVTTLVLNVIALWKQEPRSRLRKPGTPIEHTFKQAWQLFCQGPHTLRRLLAVGLGTMAFTMEDVLLEPYGGEILNMSVSSTTLLSATLALGGLLGFAWASRVLGRGGDAYRMSGWGAWIGLPAFVAVIASGPLDMPALFVLGIFLIGLGGGLFAHGTLTATMQLAPPGQIGLAGHGCWCGHGRWRLGARRRGAAQQPCHGLLSCLRHRNSFAGHDLVGHGTFAAFQEPLCTPACHLCIIIPTSTPRSPCNPRTYHGNQTHPHHHVRGFRPVHAGQLVQPPQAST
jgi:hypothetical protein